MYPLFSRRLQMIKRSNAKKLYRKFIETHYKDLINLVDESIKNSASKGRCIVPIFICVEDLTYKGTTVDIATYFEDKGYNVANCYNEFFYKEKEDCTDMIPYRTTVFNKNMADYKKAKGDVIEISF